MSRRLPLAALLLLTACAAPVAQGATPDPSSSSPTGSGDDGVVTFAVVGDSITAGNLPVVDGGAPGAGSWIPAAEGADLVLAGGWAVSGSTSADMRAAVTPVDADVVVVLAGTNDLSVAVPTATTVADVVAIVDTVGIASVLVVAVPPKDAQPTEAMGLNAVLAATAASRDWHFTDPWTEVEVDGRYADGASLDGVHPIQSVADQVGRRIASAIVSAAGRN